MRNLISEGRLYFKTLAISKIVLLAVLTKILDQVVKELEKTQKSFLWVNSIRKENMKQLIKTTKIVA